MTPLKIQVTVDNISPENGAGFSTPWFAFHDGSFDGFNVNEATSPQLELIAEDGIIGIEGQIPGFIETAIAGGLNVAGLPADVQLAISTALNLNIDLSTVPPPASTFAGLFDASTVATNGGVQGFAIVDPEDTVNPVRAQLPGVVATSTVELDLDNRANQRFFSLITMLVPTNDAFWGNDDPMAIEIFDANGRFKGADLTLLGSEVFDAGTEINDENPATTPIPSSFATFGNLGTSENGVVQPFGSFLPVGSGGALDFEVNGEQIFTNADFTVPGYAFAQVTITAQYKGSNADDRFDGGLGGDQLLGRGGQDQFNGRQGDDEINGGGGNDSLRGNDGDDTLIGGPGSDRLLGGGGNDELDGGNGNDRIKGGAGDDTLMGGKGNDQLNGSSGDDLLDGGGGSDRVKGGTGADMFVLRKKDGADTITDFVDTEDRILLKGNLNFDQLGISQVGNRTEIRLVSNDKLLVSLLGVESNLIGARDFTTR